MIFCQSNDKANIWSVLHPMGISSSTGIRAHYQLECKIITSRNWMGRFIYRSEASLCNIVITSLVGQLLNFTGKQTEQRVGFINLLPLSRGKSFVLSVKGGNRFVLVISVHWGQGPQKNGNVFGVCYRHNRARVKGRGTKWAVSSAWLECNVSIT